MVEVRTRAYRTPELTNGALGKHFRTKAQGCRSFYLGNELRILMQVFAEILALCLAPHNSLTSQPLSWTEQHQLLVAVPLKHLGQG